MAAKATKKPVTKSKLKAGQKKKVNKWLIVGGIAAVAIIGALVVRFSSASSWVSLWRTQRQMSISEGKEVQSSDFEPKLVKIAKGGTYRYCVRAYASGGRRATVELSMRMYDLNYKYVGKRAVSTKTYGTSTELHCSAEFTATKASYLVYGNIFNKYPGGPIWVQSQSVDNLR